MSADTFEVESAPRKSGWGGCLVAFAVVLLLLGIAVYWVSQSFQGWFVSFAAHGIEAMIDQSQLPEQERVELKAQVKRVTDGFSDGTISDKQMERVAEGFFTSPLISLFIIEAIEAKYFAASGLSEEEKADGRKSLERFASGLMTKQIPQQAVDEVIAPIADRDLEGKWKLRDKVTDAALREFIDAAKAKADDADIPEELEPIDPSDELQKIIDAALEGPVGG